MVLAVPVAVAVAVAVVVAMRHFFREPWPRPEPATVMCNASVWPSQALSPPHCATCAWLPFL